MKDPITTPGRTYAVTSPNGCTVTTDDGLTLAEVEAGKQGYFVAVSGKVLLSDEAAVLTQLFKLAPQQRLAILGVLGGNAGGLPAGYKRVEWLGAEKYGKYVDADIRNTDDIEIWCRFALLEEALPEDCKMFGGGRVACTVINGYFRYKVTPTTLDEYDFYGHNYNPPKSVNFGRLTNLSTGAVIESNSYFNGNIEDTRTLLFSIGIASDTALGGVGKCKIYQFEAKNSNTHRILLPCLDPTGAPCMFDTVSRKTFYNQGSGDLLYPTESSTYALRRVLPDWGKLTEHGLRRLYHAPAGYNGELYDYAIENGFKPIVEPERPEDGYWTPRWTETEDEIVLEWVETEPPMDEPLTNN